MTGSETGSKAPTSDGDAQRGRQAVGAAAAALVESGMVVGLGTGDTAAHFIRALGERLHGEKPLTGLRCVATSRRSAELGQKLGLKVIDLDELDLGAGATGRPVDITVDGADEIDPELRLVKGAGGALLFEKLVARASKKLVIIADRAKLVERLGEKRRLPVEVVTFGARHTQARLAALSGIRAADVRTASGGDYVTDSGNRIVDVELVPSVDPAALHAEIKALPGVIETGLFLTEATRVLIGDSSGHVEVRARSC